MTAFLLHLFVKYFHQEKLLPLYYVVTLSYIFARQAKTTFDSTPLLASFLFL